MSFHTLSRQLALPIAPFGAAAAFGASVFAVSAFAASGFAAGSAAGWMTSATTLVSSRQVFRVAPDGMPNVTSVPPPSLRVFRLLTPRGGNRSEEHTSELQSQMRISSAVFCLKK